MPYLMLDSGCGIELHKHWDRSLRASRESQDSCPKVIPPEMHLCLWQQLGSSCEAQSGIYWNCRRIWCIFRKLGMENLLSSFCDTEYRL